MKKLFASLLLGIIITSPAFCQTKKKALDHDAIGKWKNITETVISPDGEWISYKTEPWEGDTEVFLYKANGEKKDQFMFAKNIAFSSDSKTLIFKTGIALNELKDLKRKKTKKDDMPGEALVIYELANANKNTIENITSYKIPGKWAGYLAYVTKPAKAGTEEKTTGEEKKKTKKESAKNGFTLNLLKTSDASLKSWPFVKNYFFAAEAQTLFFISGGDDIDFDAGLYSYDIKTQNLVTLYLGKGDFKGIISSDAGDMGAFLYNADPNSKNPHFKVFKWTGENMAAEIISDASKGIPEGWVVSSNGRLNFSNNKSVLFFGTAPEIPSKDTLRLEEDYPDVDIWHGSEAKLHTVQINNKNRDANKSYMSAFHLASGKIVQLENFDIPSVRLIDRGDSKQVLAITNVPYQLQSMWEASPLHYDVYLIDTETGDRKLVKKDIRASVEASPSGKYLAWYNYMDSSYYSYNIATETEYRLTSSKTVAVASELNDIPNPPRPYRQAGWLKNDNGILISDRYDIWKLDIENRTPPQNLTVNGRKIGTTYSYVSFDREERFIDISKPLFLTGKNEVSRESGYYTWDASKASAPKQLIGGEYSLSRPQKAKDGKTLVFTKETYTEFPDLLVSDLKFKKIEKISIANPQQDDYLWGSVELVKWTSLDGKILEGLLYKPDNFDPAKKYPMIVNFYEKSSQGLFGHRTPQLHRSTIDYHYYNSNDYLIFNPDVYYEDGYPGESAFNCVMPGITALIEKGFVDKDRIGAQGHSWGGYQVAYLATRTDLFAAIESGAPVVNMFSAYGGIRWGSGLNRSFQYEHTQSRIGATIWESPLRYLENSPLFTMDKVTTPILIMHNDKDGAVPWYQGIEYFIALRRLEKPVWMLNYVGADHWPQKFKNKKDFQIRMSQFFNHYLKGEAMPVWMRDGVPVINKEYDLGYDLVKK